MRKPRFILRSLLLTILVGWMGIAAQPAAAQQAVTLSGRVTDSADNAVSGATVSLEDPGWVGQETDANGNYRLAVSPGTYLLRVRPRHGPLIAQQIEGLRLSTNTTRNFVLETGVTLSGRVTGPAGRPPAWAWVGVRNDAGQEISFNLTNATGHYSLGVPVGTYRIEVYNEDFSNKTLEGVAVPQDTVLNITLDSGALLEGTVVDDTGQPVPDTGVCAHLPTEQPPGGFCTGSESEGLFRLRVPPAVYVVTVRPVFPLRQTRLRRVEVSGEGVSDLVLTVSRDPMPFVPDDPPKAALISISAPTTDGEVTLTGAAGSVVPHSMVVAITVETGHFTTAQATASGSFRANLFAPAGTSIFVKADPVGTTVAQFVSVSLDPDLAAKPGALAALPGTILRAPDPPGAGVPVGDAGRSHFDALPVWTFQGSLASHTFAPGDPLRVRGTVRVDSPVLQGANALQVTAGLRLERLSDTDGSNILRYNTFASTFLTPTGLPIEREPRYADAGLDVYRQVPLAKTTGTQAEANIDLTLPLPSDLPAGYYRPFLNLNFPGMPRETPPSRPVILPDFSTRPHHEARLPIVQVGSPALPRLSWPLLLDTLSNGSRGILAEEDVDRFGTAQRILIPSETFVIPRLSAASDQPLTYRLEPFVPAVGGWNAVRIYAPNIPFQFPSGSLTVRLHQPDGAERVLGPAPFVQSRLKGLVDEEGFLLDGGGGHIGDAYQLTTLDPRFEVTFTQDGLHVITVEGTIDDIWGNTWSGGGTYEVYVGRVLALDTAVLPARILRWAMASIRGWWSPHQ